MLNRVTIMGRLTRDPELRHTQSGNAVTSFSLAVERDFKGQDGEKVTDFIDVVAWRNTAEFVNRYFTKGRMMVVDGRLQSRKWEDRDGNRRTSIEVVADNCYFGDSKKESSGPPPAEQYPSAGGYGDPGYGGYASGGYSAGSYGDNQFHELEEDDGELPF